MGLKLTTDTLRVSDCSEKKIVFEVTWRLTQDLNTKWEDFIFKHCPVINLTNCLC